MNEGYQKVSQSIVTDSETWCFEYCPETKRQSAAESSETKNGNIKGENYVDCIFYAKCKIHDNCYKEAIKRLITRIHRLRPGLQESGAWHLLHNASAQFLSQRGIPVLSYTPYSPHLALADFSIS
jgi:hypothetical protein